MSRGRYNIFQYFRGPSRVPTEDTQEGESPQLEDNTTKALINTLEHCEPGVTARFLQEFTATAGAAGAVTFHLQGAPKDGPDDRFLLGISVLNEIAKHSSDIQQHAHGRVDAAIVTPDLMVLIEVKVIAELDYDQLARHAVDYSIPDPGPYPATWPSDARWRLASWSAIHDWLRDTLGATSDGVSLFLLRQLIEYLEEVALSPFRGFRTEHFEFFSLAPQARQWQVQSQIKVGLVTTWDSILKKLGPEKTGLLGEIHPAQVPMDAQQAAAQTNWGEKGVNITIELSADELWINLVGWTNERARLIETWIAPLGSVRQDPRLDPFELAVFRRRPHNYAQKDTGKRPWYQQETYHFVVRTPLKELAGKSWSKLTSAWRTEADEAWEKLAYHIRKAWPRGAILADQSKLEPEMASAVDQLLVLMRDINRPVKR